MIESAELVVWDDRYATGINSIDEQHKQLIVLANKLFEACLANIDVLEVRFKEAMSSMVQYVQFHFESELKILKLINFPDYHNHKKQHDSLVQNILDAVKDYNEGKKYVPNHFARTLRDWVFTHIAVYDKMYSVYAWEQVKKGALTEKMLKEIK
jgi:hemerythrin-like metal-binding protein